MLAYIECMKGFCNGGLIVKERDGGWCLGDWCTPEDVAIPEPFVNTYYFIKSMRTVEKIAAIIGERVNYSGEIKGSLNALDKEYFDGKSGNYCGNYQGSNAFAILLGLGDERTKKNLIEKYEKSKILDTGMFGCDVLAETLVKLNRADILAEILEGTNKPSFGYMKENGATTIWEGWSGSGSVSHPMQGALVKQFLYGFFGVTANAGFENITVNPPYIANLGYIKGKFRLGKGTLGIKCVYSGGKIKTAIKTSGKIKVKLIGE